MPACFCIFVSFFAYKRISVSTNQHSKRVLRTPALLRTIQVKKQREKTMLKKGLLFGFALILMGTLDWVTTVTGTLWFGATEVNPLFAGLTQTNILLFSVIKLAAVVLTGCLFYKADKIVEVVKSNSHLGKRVLQSGYAISLIALTFAVTNNMITVASAM